MLSLEFIQGAKQAHKARLGAEVQWEFNFSTLSRYSKWRMNSKVKGCLGVKTSSLTIMHLGAFLKKIGLPRVNITIREAWEGHQVKLSIYNSQPSVIDPNHI